MNERGKNQNTPSWQSPSEQIPAYVYEMPSRQGEGGGKKNSVFPYILTSLVSVALCLLLCLSYFNLFLSANSKEKTAESKTEASKSLDRQAAELSADGRHKNGVLGFDLPYDEETELSLNKLKDVFALLKEEYYRDLSDAELLDAMLAGMLSKMDSPYTFYMDVEENKAIEESMSGNYSGIGALVMEKDGQYLITDIFDHSPAALSGLRIGDVFVSVDGRPASEFSDVSSLATAVKGVEGSKVTLVVLRAQDGEELSFELTRAKISNANLHYEMIEKGIGYIRINQFDSGVSKNFVKAIDNLMAEGAKTFVFDLRNNGGGYVAEVTRMLDYLLPKGELAKAVGRTEGKPFEESWTSGASMGVPESMRYTIIVNQYSASASELFSGCLRDWQKAELVGVTTFGKGVGTVSYDLTDGSAVQITNFHYYLPQGACVDGEGLKPDYEVFLSKEQEGMPLAQILRQEDSQLQKALEIAREMP